MKRLSVGDKIELFTQEELVKQGFEIKDNLISFLSFDYPFDLLKSIDKLSSIEKSFEVILVNDSDCKIKYKTSCQYEYDNSNKVLIIPNEMIKKILED